MKRRGRILSKTRQSANAINGLAVHWEKGKSMTEQLREEREFIENRDMQLREQERAQQRRVSTYKRRPKK